MGQSQFKVRISIATKLLGLIFLLIVTPIVFLNFSVIKIFSEDKISYIYDTQATLVQAYGREFLSLLTRSEETLKLSVSLVPEQEALNRARRDAIDTTFLNQRSVLALQINRIDPQTHEFINVYENTLNDQVSSLGFKNSDFRLAPTLASKESSSTQYFSLAKPNRPPLMAISFFDSKSQIVAIGFIDLSKFISKSTSKYSEFAILNQSGELLLHSNPERYFTEQLTAKQHPLFVISQNSTLDLGASEFADSSISNGEAFIGSYYKPNSKILIYTYLPKSIALAASVKLSEKFAVLALFSIGSMLILGLLYTRRLLMPLKSLFDGTQIIASGQFNVALPVQSKDEIGALTVAFNAMSERIAGLLEQMVEKARVDQELSIAKSVQESLFPPKFIQNKDLSIVSDYRSATECGGDWWGYFQHGHRHLIAIADATGHGLPSALMTASARACYSVIEEILTSERQNFSPSEILQLANRVVFDSAQGKIMMTFFVAEIDMQQKTIRFANAGHNPPWIFKANGSVKSLVADGLRLGESITFNPPPVSMSESIDDGDLIVFYTDGILEGKNLSQEAYGKKRTRSIIAHHRSAGPQAVSDGLLQDFMQFNGAKELDDDITLAIVAVHSHTP